jgi:Protein of unknown function (DUF2806)
LFSKILAGELRSPGSFSLKSLSLLSVIDQNDAKIFHKIFGYVVMGDAVLKDAKNIPFREYLDLEVLGILKGVDSLGLALEIPNNKKEIHFQYGN